MEKNLKQILSEMKKLMEYNPSIGKIINEQDPDFDIDPRLGSQKSDRLGKGGTFDRQQKELTRKGVKSTDGYFYRQSFNEHKGYFDNNMMLGECFDIINFTTNDNALTSMNIPKDKMFKDEIGYYIKGKTNAYGDSRDIRIYLPKDDFFRNLNGVVKWVEELQHTGIIDRIGRVIFFHCDHNGRAFEHRDLDARNGVLGDHQYTPHNNEFIHIRYRTKRGFYIWDPDTENKYYINANAAFWNDQDWHGGEESKEIEYGMRIDCKFSNSFREQLGIDHLEHY